MSKRIGLGPADRAVAQSRLRVGLSRGLTQHAMHLSFRSRYAIEASRILLNTTESESFARVSSIDELAAITTPSNAWNGNEFDELIDGLIAAYLTAQANGDAEMEAEIRNALECAGHYLAAKLGPKAAGVALS